MSLSRPGAVPLVASVGAGGFDHGVEIFVGRVAAAKVFSVHMKDLRIGRGPGDFVSFKEVLIGDGSMDYETYLRRLALLPEDTPCFCEHLATEAEYALNFARVRAVADKVGVAFAQRNVY